MDEPGGHYVQWNKPVTDRQIPPWSHLFVDSKNIELIEVEYRMVVSRDWGWENIDQNTKYQRGWLRSRDLLYHMVTIINNNVL